MRIQLSTPVSARVSTLQSALSRFVDPTQITPTWQSELGAIDVEFGHSSYSKRYHLAGRLAEIEDEITRKTGLYLTEETGYLAGIRWLHRVQRTLGLPRWGERRPSKLSDGKLIQETRTSNRSVPDLIVIELAKRYAEQPEVFQESVNHLVHKNPLRLSSVEGLRLYLNVFEADESAQDELLTTLLTEGQNDMRVVPMIQALVKHHADAFRAHHVPYFIKIVKQNPQLEERLMELRDKRPDFIWDVMNAEFSLADAVDLLRKESSAPEARLATTISKYLEGMKYSEIQELITGHFMRLGAMDDSGEWKDAALAYDFSAVDVTTLQDLVWQMAALARANIYLHGAFSRMTGDALQKLFSLSAKQGQAVARDVITFAMAMEGLTRHIATDSDKLRALTEAVSNPMGILGDLAHHGVAHGFKYDIVEDAFEGIIQDLSDKDVDPNEFHRLLWLNIVVMGVMDDIQNTAAGQALAGRARYRTAKAKADPTVFNPDSEALELSFLSRPLPWVNLYSSWNFVLGLQSPMSPYFVTKLLIPSVQDYYNNPKAYMHFRVIALYFFMTWRQSGPDSLSNGEEIDWILKDLADALADVNLESVKDFEDRADQAGYGRTTPGTAFINGIIRSWKVA